jgi:hypothetical protein
MELGSGMKLSLRRGLVYCAASIPYLAPGDSGHETEDQSGGDADRQFAALRPTIMHIEVVPSVRKLRCLIPNSCPGLAGLNSNRCTLLTMKNHCEY